MSEGRGFSGVTTTGIYCRPGCGGRPRADHVQHFETAAAAEVAGYRACLQCRPYRSSEVVGSVTAPELVCRAVQLIVDGALDEADEATLGTRVGVSARHLRRIFAEHVGATPDQLARSRRAHFARRLLDDTDLSITTIAFAAGFGSVRQFNRTMRDVFRASPGDLRARRRRADRLAADGGLAMRLPYRPPFDWSTMLGFLSARAIPGVEAVDGTTYRRTIVVDGDPGVIEVAEGGDDFLVLRAHLPHWEGLIHHVQRVRSMLDLDTDPDEVNAALRNDRVLRPLVDAGRGVRVPGAWDPFETGVRAIIGQQISVAGATTIIGRLVERLGTAVPGLNEMRLSHTFPDPHVVASGHLGGLGLTDQRAGALRAFATAIRDGDVRLDRGAGTQELVRSLTALPGIGDWTAHYIALRLGDADAFPSSDLGLRKAIATNGTMPSAREVERRAEAWRPWRAYAAMLLWTKGLVTSG